MQERDAQFGLGDDVLAGGGQGMAIIYERSAEVALQPLQVRRRVETRLRRVVGHHRQLVHDRRRPEVSTPTCGRPSTSATASASRWTTGRTRACESAWSSGS